MKMPPLKGEVAESLAAKPEGSCIQETQNYFKTQEISDEP